MNNYELFAGKFGEKLLETMEPIISALENIAKLYASRDEMQLRNRANIAAHIAYTKRKGTPCQLTKSDTPKP